VALPPEALTPFAHKRVRGETLAGSRGGAAKSQIADKADDKRAAAPQNRERRWRRHGQLSWLLHARARAAKSRRGGRPTAQPRGKSNKEVAAWAVARLVSTVLDARKWGRPVDMRPTRQVL